MIKERTFYHIILNGAAGTHPFADERIKKRFLDNLFPVKEKVYFQIYAYCITNNEAHFLIRLAKDTDAADFLRLLEQEYDECCKKHMRIRSTPLTCSYYPVEIKNVTMLMERSAQIHQYALDCAQYIEDHWWSSYNDYTNRYCTGLVETEEILTYLDISPRKAAQKFASYHKKICCK